MSDDPEPADRLDPERYDRRFEHPWGRHGFPVERDALLDALGPLNGRELVELGCGNGIRPGLGWLAHATEHAGRWAPGIGAFKIAVLDLPEPPR